MKGYVKYILIILCLNFGLIQLGFSQDPCYQRIGVEGGGFGWSYENGDSPTNPIEESFTQPATNAGFSLDIFILDNSFNMEINGVDLATQEIEFQSNGTSGINVRFADGDEYENQTDPIWQLAGDAANPLIRVQISENGEVSLYGSKESFGPLFPLELINGNALNTITWNSTGTNTVIARQNVVGATEMTGTGYGLDEVPCEEMYDITKDGEFVDSNSDGYAQIGENISYTFEVEHTGNHEAVYGVEIMDPILSDDPIGLSSGTNLLGGTLSGDDNTNNVLDIGEVWTFTVDYQTTEEDIYWNKGVYNQTEVKGERESGQQLPEKESTDPTPYQSGDAGWDPARPEHTYVPLNGKGNGLLISNPMLPSKGRD
ncbi:hypothetical protein FKX85_19675 [Echinicola soli]|uniref:DUF7507 domain-containing protein n=1 Tax=Echinicola soli TaxID=2591634 RepID=A0A514CMT2_9BACT|nr:hypothetical protein [Echinicola soli]QDH81129.1 hypothetical protein FKX85_19675 [Echinicola soli]